MTNVSPRRDRRLALLGPAFGWPDHFVVTAARDGLVGRQVLRLALRLDVAGVGVAMGSGTDVARESADIVLLGNDLSKFAETVMIARRAHRIIRFNFVGTIVVDAGHRSSV